MFIARRGPYPPGSHYVALHPLTPPASKMPTAPEMGSSHSYTTVRLASHSRYSPSLTHGALSSHGLGLRPLMFAQRHIFFRLRAFISGCLAALDAASPFPARVMPMEIGISFSCPKKTLRLSLLRTSPKTVRLTPHSRKYAWLIPSIYCSRKLQSSAFTVRLAASHSPSLSLGVHHQARLKRFDFVVLAVGIFLIILNVLLRHNNPQWHSVRNADFF